MTVDKDKFCTSLSKKTKQFPGLVETEASQEISILHYLLFLKKQQNLKYSSAANDM